GEREALRNDPEAIIIRTAWVYSAYGNNFVKTMLRLMNSRETLNVVADQHGSPTYAADLAEAIMHIIMSGEWVPGIYHYTNDGIISWFDFASQIQKLSGAACAVMPITTEQYPTPAKRPKYSVLDKSKIQNTYGLPLKDWKQSLESCIVLLSKEVS
ncbi:MAG TPA: sugar nucleotide-binding protein, partial [Chitinophagaceae bacterium]|nr:sugar nucleotide-binding protein [Chitinophagaceae bacterium]